MLLHLLNKKPRDIWTSQFTAFEQAIREHPSSTLLLLIFYVWIGVRSAIFTKFNKHV